MSQEQAAKIDYDQFFGRGQRSLSIQNIKPPHETARNIFADDERQIMAAAREHGYQIVSPPKARIVSFCKMK